MSDIEQLTNAITTLTRAITDMTKAPPVSSSKPAKKQPVPTIEPPPQQTASPSSPVDDQIEAVNRLCIQKSISVANAQLLIKHELLESYQVKGIGNLKPGSIDTFSQFVQDITAQDVELFLAQHPVSNDHQESTL